MNNEPARGKLVKSNYITGTTRLNELKTAGGRQTLQAQFLLSRHHIKLVM